jgi:hypothetical protein
MDSGLARMGWLQGLAASLMLLTPAIVCAARDAHRAQPSPVKLGKVPRITLEKRAVATQPSPEHIEQLIADLTKIDSPDYGLSPTLSAEAFAPLPGFEKAEVLLLADHQIKSSPAFRELVELGPRAMPFLLAALGDYTPTELTIEHPGMMGGMWFAQEVPGNPANATEQRALSPVAGHGRYDATLPKEDVRSYTVKVGDVCFVIIGQIVGRKYLAVRYQPSGCIVLNSPTTDEAIAQAVKAAWSGDDPCQYLLDSLLLDYSTEGIYRGKGFDEWYVGSNLQVGAAMRLLYYFPREAAPMIVLRIRSLQVHGTGFESGVADEDDRHEAWTKRELANRVWTDEFIKAVAWSDQPSIKAEVGNVFARTNDPDIMLRCLRALDKAQAPSILNKLGAFIDTLPPSEHGSFGDGYNVLVALGRSCGEKAKPVFQRYLKIRTVQRCRTMCHVLAETRGEWAIEMLSPLLEDERLADGWTYAVERGSNEPRLPIRICDEAAGTISKSHPDMTFEMVGTHENLGRQIQQMLDMIRKKSSSQPASR